jgi:hypothetical protein
MDEVLAILAEKISEKETEISKLQSAYDCIADLSAVVAPVVEEVEVDDLGDETEETAAESDPMEALDAAEQIIIDATEDYDEDLNEVMKPYE